MRSPLALVVAVILFHYAIASTLPSSSQNDRDAPPSHVLHEWHERRHTEGWKVVEKAHRAATLPMRVGLRQSNIDKGHDLLMDISHPESSNYGKHLTSEEVVDMFAPASESVRAVRGWLLSEGISVQRISRSRNKQWIQFDATVDEAEKLLYTEFQVYEHGRSGIRNIACSGYYVPREIQEHIDYVTPGVRLLSEGYNERRTKQTKNRRDLGKASSFQSDIAYVDHDDESLVTGYVVTGECDTQVTLDCIKVQYQIPNGTTASPGNQLGIFQSLGDHFYQDDLDSYFDNLAPWVSLGTQPTLNSIDGATGEADSIDDSGAESSLDFSLAMPLIWPQTTILFQTNDDWYEVNQAESSSTYPGFFNTFFDALDGSYCSFAAYNETGDCTTSDCMDPSYPDPNPGGYDGPLMCGNYTPTNVISISYSGIEHALPDYYMQRQCAEIMKLALQGVTVVESSGDHGVGGTKSDPSSGCLGEERNVYSPRTMSNCPYVLSVGATVLFNVTAELEELFSMFSKSTASSVSTVPSWTTTLDTIATSAAVTIISSAETATESSDTITPGSTATSQIPATSVSSTNISLSSRPDTSSVTIAASAASTSTSTFDPASDLAAILGLPTSLLEIATTSFASGGGFSNVFARPAYQDAYVVSYLNTTGLWAQGYDGPSSLSNSSSSYNYSAAGAAGLLFNRLGRAYPDVAALGDNIPIFNKGAPIKVGGTSAAVPVWASILTLINEERLNAGKGTVGFVHPVLYAHPEVFTDVTIGSNPGCGSEGFQAAEGWDPVTGLGSPIYPKLLQLFMSLP